MFPTEATSFDLEEACNSVEERAENIENALPNVRTAALENIARAQEKQASYYNRNARNVHFEIGQRVLKENKTGQKFDPKWFEPFNILDVIYPNVTIQADELPNAHPKSYTLIA